MIARNTDCQKTDRTPLEVNRKEAKNPIDVALGFAPRSMSVYSYQERRKAKSMKLSQALMFSLLCLGVAGCSSIQDRIRAPFDARSATGPNTLATPLTAPASTITVAPQKAPAKLYNMDEGKKRSTQAAKPKRTTAPSKASETAVEESAPAARSVSVPSQAPEVSQEAKAPSGETAPTGGADESLNLRPARKGATESSGPPAQEAPQSSAPHRTKPGVVGDGNAKPAEVLPVSSPTESRKIDSKLSS
jgi:hypothetical protein